MKVWILHHDVDFEFGVILGVYSTEQLAEKAKKDFLSKDKWMVPMEVNIEEWEVE
jgi:hypothetical protein